MVRLPRLTGKDVIAAEGEVGFDVIGPGLLAKFHRDSEPSREQFQALL